MNNLLITLLLCMSFCVQAGTLPMITGYDSVAEINVDSSPLRESAKASLTFTFDCDEIGITSRTFFYRDGNGQEGRCNNVLLQVNDPLRVCAEAPNVNCQPFSQAVADVTVPVTVNANAFDNGSTSDNGVYSLVFNPEADRQDYMNNRNCNSSLVGFGQSFTAGKTGAIQFIRVRSADAINTTLHLYEGNNGSGIPGEVGTPAYSQPVRLFFGFYGSTANATTILLNEPFPVVEGQEYTFILEDEVRLSRSCASSPSYAGGPCIDADVAREMTWFY